MSIHVFFTMERAYLVELLSYFLLLPIRCAFLYFSRPLIGQKNKSITRVSDDSSSDRRVSAKLAVSLRLKTAEERDLMAKSIKRTVPTCNAADEKCCQRITLKILRRKKNKRILASRGWKRGWTIFQEERESQIGHGALYEDCWRNMRFYRVKGTRFVRVYNIKKRKYKNGGRNRVSLMSIKNKNKRSDVTHWC